MPACNVTHPWQLTATSVLSSPEAHSCVGAAAGGAIQGMLGAIAWYRSAKACCSDTCARWDRCTTINFWTVPGLPHRPSGGTPTAQQLALIADFWSAFDTLLEVQMILHSLS